MVSASALVLVGRKFDSRPGLAKTLKIGTAVFLPGARCAEAHVVLFTVMSLECSLRT